MEEQQQKLLLNPNDQGEMHNADDLRPNSSRVKKVYIWNENDREF